MYNACTMHVQGLHKLCQKFAVDIPEPKARGISTAMVTKGGRPGMILHVRSLLVRTIHQAFLEGGWLFRLHCKLLINSTELATGFIRQCVYYILVR